MSVHLASIAMLQALARSFRKQASEARQGPQAAQSGWQILDRMADAYTAAALELETKMKEGLGPDRRGEKKK